MQKPSFKICDWDLWKFETSRPTKNASKISRLVQNFPRPTFFKEPFSLPLLVWNSLSNIEDFYVTFITKISSVRVMITACNRTYLQLKVKIHLHQIMHALSSSNLARSHQMHPRISLLAWERIQENYLLKIKITLTSLSNKLL